MQILVSDSCMSLFATISDSSKFCLETSNSVCNLPIRDFKLLQNLLPEDAKVTFSPHMKVRVTERQDK